MTTSYFLPLLVSLALLFTGTEAKMTKCTEPKSIIISPSEPYVLNPTGYPVGDKQLNDNQKCLWHVKSRTGHPIEVLVQEFHLHDKHDHLSVFDGMIVHGKKPLMNCTLTSCKGVRLQSSGDELTILLKTNEKHDQGYFKIRLSPIHARSSSSKTMAALTSSSASQHRPKSPRNTRQIIKNPEILPAERSRRQAGSALEYGDEFDDDVRAVSVDNITSRVKIDNAEDVNDVEYTDDGGIQWTWTEEEDGDEEGEEAAEEAEIESTTTTSSTTTFGTGDEEENDSDWSMFEIEDEDDDEGLESETAAAGDNEFDSESEDGFFENSSSSSADGGATGGAKGEVQGGGSTEFFEYSSSSSAGGDSSIGGGSGGGGGAKGDINGEVGTEGDDGFFEYSSSSSADGGATGGVKGEVQGGGSTEFFEYSSSSSAGGDTSNGGDGGGGGAKGDINGEATAEGDDGFFEYSSSSSADEGATGGVKGEVQGGGSNEFFEYSSSSSAGGDTSNGGGGVRGDNGAVDYEYESAGTADVISWSGPSGGNDNDDISSGSSGVIRAKGESDSQGAGSGSEGGIDAGRIDIENLRPKGAIVGDPNDYESVGTVDAITWTGEDRGNEGAGYAGDSLSWSGGTKGEAAAIDGEPADVVNPTSFSSTTSTSTTTEDAASEEDIDDEIITEGEITDIFGDWDFEEEEPSSTTGYPRQLKAAAAQSGPARTRVSVGGRSISARAGQRGASVNMSGPNRGVKVSPPRRRASVPAPVSPRPSLYRPVRAPQYNAARYPANNQQCGEEVVTLRIPKSCPGIVGPRGPPGVCSRECVNGRDGRPGTQGPSGSAGEPGTPAVCDNVRHGMPGMKGQKGAIGYGRPGQKGEPGPVQYAPAPQPRSMPGAPGRKGDAGRNGSNGRPGPPGPPGPAGRPGPVGPRGYPGTGGNPGVPGTTYPDNGGQGPSNQCRSCPNSCQNRPGYPPCDGCCDQYEPVAPPAQPCRRCPNECRQYPNMPQCGNCCPFEDYNADGYNDYNSYYNYGRNGNNQGGLPRSVRNPESQQPPAAAGRGAAASENQQSGRAAQGDSTPVPSSQTLTFTNDRHVYDSEDYVDIGTLAFSAESNRLFLRSCDGWRLVTDANRRALLSFTAGNRENSEQEGREDLVRIRQQTKLQLIALNEAQSGNMGGIQGADLKCRSQARAAGIRNFNNFRALLHSQKRDLRQLVSRENQNAAIVTLRGQLLYRSFADLLARKPFYNVPLVSFDGKSPLTNRSVWPNLSVWNGFGLENCQGWQSDSGRGSGSTLKRSSLLETDQIECNKENIVLCIEHASGSGSVSRRLRNRRRRV